MAAAENEMALELGLWFGKAVKKHGGVLAARCHAASAIGVAQVTRGAVSAVNRDEIARLLRQAADEWERA